MIQMKDIYLPTSRVLTEGGFTCFKPNKRFLTRVSFISGLQFFLDIVKLTTNSRHHNIYLLERNPSEPSVRPPVLLQTSSIPFSNFFNVYFPFYNLAFCFSQHKSLFWATNIHLCLHQVLSRTHHELDILLFYECM